MWAVVQVLINCAIVLICMWNNSLGSRVHNLRMKGLWNSTWEITIRSYCPIVESSINFFLDTYFHIILYQSEGVALISAPESNLPVNEHNFAIYMWIGPQCVQESHRNWRAQSKSTDLSVLSMAFRTSDRNNIRNSNAQCSKLLTFLSILINNHRHFSAIVAEARHL